MAETGITQEQLAAAMSVTQGAVSGWMQGAKPRAAKLKRLNDFLDSLSAKNKNMVQLPSAAPVEITLSAQSVEAVAQRVAQLLRGDETATKAAIAKASAALQQAEAKLASQKTNVRP